MFRHIFYKSKRSDFFKDYPPIDPSTTDDADQPAPTDTDDAMGDPMNAFVLGEPDGEPTANGDSDSAPPIILGGPPPADDAEPENPAVTQWRIDFARRLEEKVTKEREVKAERAEKARQTLATMHQRWERTARETADVNKRAEKEFLRERDGVISRMSGPGEKPNWDIIPELVDMTGKFKEGARDTSRMRQVLLRMKTN